MKLDETLFNFPGVTRNLRFYVTNPGPCPYLPGKLERKGFTHLTQSQPDALHDALSQAGFRRSQSVAYRPACANCNACRSVRCLASQFKASRNQKRSLKQNADLVRRPVIAQATREQYRLLKTYLKTRHDGGGMSGMSYRDYCAMVNDSPVKSVMFEYRQGNIPDAPLMAVALTDILRDGLSMVYTFFNPEDSRRSLGSYMILDHIMHARELGLPHTYLGYWIKDSDKMNYKSRFKPLEILDGSQWRRMRDDEQ
ncbi:MAG: arginyltransferase [Hyphomonadaceae bacterium]|nr:arginyltransferase [Hyphomonadaceae bacterium]OUX95468.1 MAG: arginyltransferase [Hyphomonas sp. TMED17]CAI8313081.1 MAG: Putative arginyl-tRNA--protein transferase [Hyphomonas sp. TMED17]